jgi:hypothetical protein
MIWTLAKKSAVYFTHVDSLVFQHLDYLQYRKNNASEKILKEKARARARRLQAFYSSKWSFA